MNVSRVTVCTFLCPCSVLCAFSCVVAVVDNDVGAEGMRHLSLALKTNRTVNSLTIGCECVVLLRVSIAGLVGLIIVVGGMVCNHVVLQFVKCVVLCCLYVPVCVRCGMQSRTTSAPRACGTSRMLLRPTRR